jgi:hypothetical protein
VEHNQWGENHLKTNYHTAEHFSSNRGNSITLTVPVEEEKKTPAILAVFGSKVFHQYYSFSKYRSFRNSLLPN